MIAKKNVKKMERKNKNDSLFWAWGLTSNVVNMFYEYINAIDKN